MHQWSLVNTRTGSVTAIWHRAQCCFSIKILATVTLAPICLIIDSLSGTYQGNTGEESEMLTHVMFIISERCIYYIYLVIKSVPSVCFICILGSSTHAILQCNWFADLSILIPKSQCERTIAKLMVLSWQW